MTVITAKYSPSSDEIVCANAEGRMVIFSGDVTARCMCLRRIRVLRHSTLH